MLHENYQIWFGASVSARSVKLINEKTTERDAWWQELRKEMDKNAESLNCNYIIGYKESVEVFDTVMILSASGTAIKVKQKPQLNIPFLKLKAI